MEARYPTCVGSFPAHIHHLAYMIPLIHAHPPVAVCAEGVFTIQEAARAINFAPVHHPGVDRHLLDKISTVACVLFRVCEAAWSAFCFRASLVCLLLCRTRVVFATFEVWV